MADRSEGEGRRRDAAGPSSSGRLPDFDTLFRLQIELSVANLALLQQAMRLGLVGVDQMEHRPASRREELRDEAPVAAKPRCLVQHV